VDNGLRILVVDDEAVMREVLAIRLEQMGLEVHLAANGSEAREVTERVQPDLVISDVMMPDIDGLELLRILKAGDPDRPVVLITAHGTVDSAVEALKRGALDFLTKPLDYDKLAAVLDTARTDLAQRRARSRLESTLDRGAGLGSLIGRSKPMRQVFKVLQMLGDSDASAIVTGESGTGKELVAQTVHALSGRANRPFVAVNTAAIPETLTESELFGHDKGAFTGAMRSRPGYFEQADGGTLFLDEISEMQVGVQAKLLRVLEDGRVRRIGSARDVVVDVRVLAATNRRPDQAVKQGKLREDVFYRLSVFTVELPPLRDRIDDLPLLTQHFIRQFNNKHSAEIEGVSEDALACLSSYRWPGNVRELRNVIERAVIIARRSWIEAVHLPPFIRERKVETTGAVTLPAGTTVAEAEKRLILETLKQLDNNKSRAARALGIDVKTIRYKLRSYAEGG
jgi:DNA-binding NtrC family response regulator